MKRMVKSLLRRHFEKWEATLDVWWNIAKRLAKELSVQGVMN